MSTLTLVYSIRHVVLKLDNAIYCKSTVLYALIKSLFLGPLVNYFGQKNIL